MYHVTIYRGAGYYSDPIVAQFDADIGMIQGLIDGAVITRMTELYDREEGRILVMSFASGVWYYITE